MSWKAQIDDRGVITRYKDTDSGEVISAQEYERRMQMQQTTYSISPGAGMSAPHLGSPMYVPAPYGGAAAAPYGQGGPPVQLGGQDLSQHLINQGLQQAPPAQPMAQPMAPMAGPNPLIQPGAQMLGQGAPLAPQAAPMGQAPTGQMPMPGQFNLNSPSQAMPPSAGQAIQGKNLRMEGVPGHHAGQSIGYRSHGFLDATSIAILLPTLVLLALIIAAAHKKRLFPWQTIRTFNPPSGLMTPRDYERSFVCPPNLRRHGRLGKKNPNASWTDVDGVVLPFGFLARTHLPVTIPMGRLPNKNMFLVAPSGSGKTTLMRAIMKALLAKPCVIIALEAKANDPNLDEKKEGFKYTVLPEAQQAGFDCLYFNPLDLESIHWNPLDLDPITFASSIVQDVNSLPPEEQHWAERDHGYIQGLAQLLKWGAVQVTGEDENGSPAEVQPLPCNPRGLMKLVNNRRNIVESLRRLKNNPHIDAAELSELTQKLSSIIRTDTDWDKNIQGVRGRLRMFNNKNVVRVTEQSNVDLNASMHKPTVLIFGAPASMGPDAESLAACFVYQLQNALHTRYGTASVLPLFAFFDEYQTLNLDIAGRLSAIVRGANGGLTVILQNVSQIASSKQASGDSSSSGMSELKTIFSNSAIRVCLHNADETTAKFFSEEIGKHAVIVPGIADHYQATGFGIFPSSWNRIHSQQVVARVDTDSIKRMEKHHALVFLSPAGDAEFGEAKPMMVDLRGIEEIARLHLLHNMSAKRVPPGHAQEGPGGGSPDHPLPSGSVPGFARSMGQAEALARGTSNAAPPQSNQPEQYNIRPAQAQYVQAGAHSQEAPPRLCPNCAKPAGTRKFCIECGAFLGAPEPAQPAQQQYVELKTSAHIAGQEPHAQPAQYPLGEAVASNAPPFPTRRPSLGGLEQGIRESAPLIRSSLLESPQQIAEAAQQMAAPPAPQGEQPAQSPFQRRPVTSFTPDPSRFGFNQPPSVTGEKGTGVEF
ncbi:MAG TPA: type IV secretory system conjugative DNA transfer family protein [Candidatus Obscuribacterales bacterium]